MLFQGSLEITIVILYSESNSMIQTLPVDDQI